MNKKHVGKLRKLTGQPIAECKRVLDSIQPKLVEHYVKFYETHSRDTFIDPQEVDPELTEIFKEVDVEVKSFMDQWKKERIAKFNESEREFMLNRSAYHIACLEKQRIMEERYNIKWFSPVQMNPNVIFD